MTLSCIISTPMTSSLQAPYQPQMSFPRGYSGIWLEESILCAAGISHHGASVVVGDAVRHLPVKDISCPPGPCHVMPCSVFPPGCIEPYTVNFPSSGHPAAITQMGHSGSCLPPSSITQTFPDLGHPVIPPPPNTGPKRPCDGLINLDYLSAVEKLDLFGYSTLDPSCPLNEMICHPGITHSSTVAAALTTNPDIKTFTTQSERSQGHWIEQ